MIAITRNITILMALRELTRGIGRYRGALLMMAFTLSLTGFTASMASTLDRSLEDTVAYKVGADLVLETAVDAQTESSQDDSGETTTTVTGYNVPPIEDLYQVDGIAYASRVGYYPVQLRLPGQIVSGEVLGMDRGALAAIAHFREDYASRNLAAILNELAGDRTGLIIDRGTLETYGLALGQQIEMQVNALDAWYTSRVPVVAVIDYFPTLDPREGFFALANIDPIFELVGTSLPHDVWLALEPGADPEAVKAGIEEIGFPVLRYVQPEVELQAARAEPSRRGVFGFLSVGFVASIALTLIAAVIQSTASFQAQSTQLGALRAMGLGGLSVAIYVILLQGLVALSGILSGTAIGIGSTVLYLPLLDFSGGLPPYLIRVAWDEIAVVYAVFAGVLFAITTLTTLILSRAKLATVIRLGDI
jgi:putative ABC transport system permease protein